MSKNIICGILLLFETFDQGVLLGNLTCAKAAMIWLYELPPDAKPLDYLEKLLAHLQSKGHNLNSFIAPEDLGSNEAFIARLESETCALTPADLQNWVHWGDSNPGENPKKDLEEFVGRGQLPWHLRAYRNDAGKLQEVIRTPPKR